MAAAVTPMNALAALPLMKWRGLAAPPYTMANFQIRHIQAERAYIGLDGSGHDHQRREAIPMDFTLWFVNGLERRTNLFPDLWDKWFKALDDGTPDELVHPLLGPLDARVLSFGGDIDAKTRAGVVIQVSFTDTIKNPLAIKELARPSVQLKPLAQAVINQFPTRVDLPDGTVPFDLFMLIGQLEGFAFSITNNIDGIVNKIKGLCDRLIRLVEIQQEHIDYAVIGHLEAIYMAVDEVGKNHGILLDRATAKAVADVSTTLSKIARERDNTLAEIMGLNAELLAVPVIAAGTAYRYFT